MHRQLPPLNGLRAFEAAARHLSFTKAAEELFVTQAAISHQVKSLEGILKVELFLRVNRGLVLSEQGAKLYPAIRESLDMMANAVRDLNDDESTGVLRVSTMDSIAATWLVPRFGRFRKQHQDIMLQLSLGDRLVDFARDEVDLAIRYGEGKWPGCESEFLMNEEIFPVIAPDLLETGHSINEPADLLKYTLLHDQMPEGWTEWFKAAGAGHIRVDQGYDIEHSHLIIQAAIGGAGIALGRGVLVAGALKSGLLVRLFDIGLTGQRGYYLCGPAAVFKKPKTHAFLDWLKEEIALTEQALGPEGIHKA